MSVQSEESSADTHDGSSPPKNLDSLEIMDLDEGFENEKSFWGALSNR